MLNTKKPTTRNELRIRRHNRGRKKISGTAAQPRVSVYRSLTNIFAQVIDDENGVTLASCSTIAKDVRDSLNGLKKSDCAKLVGKKLAEVCKSKGIEKVVFDRGGYRYQGRVKALAEGAREGGLLF